MSKELPNLPFDGFPLRPHRNGSWYKSVWNPRTKRSEQFYFGSWRDDPRGERAISDPAIGWLARRPGILAGIDNVRVQSAADDIGLGELMTRFLTFKRNKAQAGELSLSTLADYLREIELFVAFMKPAIPVSALRPEHFTAYMDHLINDRNLGRMARKRVRAYVTAFLRYGATNSWYTMPNTGCDWAAPATDPDAMRQMKARAGIKDFSDRIFTGDELNRLLNRASPTFRAMVLLAVNTGLGPADIGRLTWDRIDLDGGKLDYPRYKTGTARVGYLWKRTRKALQRVRSLKHNRIAIEQKGEDALVFVTRRGLPFYREREVYETVPINGKSVRKLKGIVVANAISITFGRMARQLGLEGATFYRCRHTFRTLAKNARDTEASNLMMGHKDRTSGNVYDHEPVESSRIKKVAKTVYRRLWPRVKQSAGTLTGRHSKALDADAARESVAA
jgi:integrase